MKPFKTISLTDRLKTSIYSDISARPSSEVVQGVINLKTNILSRPPNESQLKSLPTIRKRGESLIKSIPKVQLEGTTLTLARFQTTPLTSFLLPNVQTKFGKTMQLADRLQQSSRIESTKHLAQFFVSDTYTDYIKIKPFGVLNHISDVTIPTFNFIGNKGGVDVSVGRSEAGVLISQGTFFTNGNFISKTVLGQPITQDAIIRGQGAAFSNGEYKSTTKLNTPLSVIKQGGVNPIAAISPITLALLQGVTISNGSYTSSIKPLRLVTKVKLIPLTLSRPGFSSLLFNQGEVELLNRRYDNLVVDQGTIQLQTAAYLASRAVSVFLPRIGHGSALLPTTDFQNGGAFSQTLVRIQGGDWFMTNRQVVSVSKLSQLLNSELNKSDAETLLKSEILGWKYERTGIRQGKDPEGNVRVVNQSIPSVWNANTNKPIPGVIEKRSLLNKPNVEQDEHSDFVAFQIDSISGGSIRFKALITSLSDSWSPSWSDINYVGRQDTLRVFKGVTRNVSFGFKVVAWSNATTMFEKLQNLARITSVGSPTGPGYVKGPLIKLTLGKMFDKVYCACTSLKFDFNPAEFTWDIDKQLPMLADVSMDVAILTSNNAQMLDSKTNTYFNH